MKAQLDRLGKVENLLWKVWGYGAILIVPMLVLGAVDRFFLHDEPALVRYPVLLVLWLVTFMFGLALGGAMNGVFKGIRRLLGMRPIEEIQREIDDEKTETETSTAESSYRWMTTMSDSDFRISVLQRLEQQKRRLDEINTELHYFFMFVVVIVVVAGIARFW